MRVPKFYLLKHDLLALIGGAAPGTALPTERDLAERFGTSRTTVRQAIAALVVDGRLARTQGSGTYVAEPKLMQVRTLSSFTDDVRRLGQQPDDVILAVGSVRAPAEVAARLGLGAGVPVVRVERLRGTGDGPVAYEIAYLAGKYTGLKAELRRRGSLYRTLDEVYDVRPASAEDTVETALAGPDEARLLGVEIGLPMLLVQRTAWDRDGAPLEWTRSMFRGDRFRFVARTSDPAGPT